MRAHQLGFISSNKIVEIAKDQLGEINLSEKEWKDIDKKVCKKLSKFQQSEEV